MPELILHPEYIEDPQVLVDLCPFGAMDVGRILRTFKIKKNVEVTDNG